MRTGPADPTRNYGPSRWIAWSEPGDHRREGIQMNRKGPRREIEAGRIWRTGWLVQAIARVGRFDGSPETRNSLPPMMYRLGPWKDGPKRINHARNEMGFEDQSHNRRIGHEQH
jgi:hypothetical protein